MQVKRHTIKNHSNMFRIVCVPSSGSIELYLTEIIRSGSQMFFVCLLGVWKRNFWTHGVRARYDGLQPVVPCTHTMGSKITLPNTEQAHEKHLWTTANNFIQVQLYTPWWWNTYDPKHVGVIFNFVSFNFYTT